MIGLTFREGRAEGDCTRQENGEDGKGEEGEGEGSTEVFFQYWGFYDYFVRITGEKVFGIITMMGRSSKVPYLWACVPRSKAR